MVKIVGHRGAKGYAPENTILSFQKAIDIGCQAVEFDVRLTKDKEAVVIHDKEVDKVSDGTGLVSEMTLDDIKRLNCPEDQKISTLEEVVLFCKGKIDLRIELKEEGTPAPVAQMIAKHQLASNVVVISFNIELVREIKKIDPALKVGLIFREVPDGLWSLVSSTPLDYICPIKDLVTADMVEKAHTAGVKIFTWDVDDKQTGDNLIKLGVDEIGTDVPKIFI